MSEDAGKTREKKLYELMERIRTRHDPEDDRELEELADEAIREIDPDSKAPALLRHAAHARLVGMAYKLGERGLKLLISDIADSEYLPWVL